MYILSVEGVAILPVETAEEIAEWLLKTPLILWSLGFFSFFLKVLRQNGWSESSIADGGCIIRPCNAH